MDSHPNHRRRKHGKKTSTSIHLKSTENKKSGSERQSPAAKLHDTNGVNTQRKPRPNVAVNCSTIFPKGSIWIIWILTVAIRLFITLKYESGWILHPDEVFQSVEVAHSLVYGYGFRPYEYLPPPDPNATLTVERQEAATGMYSLRSFLYPKGFAIYLWLLETCGIQGNPFRMCRLLHTLVASHLPVSVYLFMNRLLWNSCFDRPAQGDISTLCSLLVSFSTPLAVLGTHSLVNSFLAPLTFVTLAMFLGFVNEARSQPSIDSPCTQNTKPSDQKKTSGDSDGNLNFNNNIKYNNNEINGEQRTVTANQSDSLVPSNVTLRHSTERNVNGNMTKYMFSCLSRNPPVQSRTEKTLNGLNNPMNASPSPTRPSDEMFHHAIGPPSTCIYPLSHKYKTWFIGFVIGLLVYIRPDQILLTCSISGTYVLSCLQRNVISRMFSLTLHLCIGAGLGLFVGGVEDKMAYNFWFLSPYQWFSFNVQSGMSSALFGSQNLLYYARELFLRDHLSMLCSFLLVVMFIWNIAKCCHPKGAAPYGHSRVLLKLGLPFASLLVVYSLQRHKELRFIHNVLVLFNLQVGIAIYVIASAVKKLSFRKSIICGVLALWLSNWWLSLPVAENKSNKAWSYQENWDTSAVNDCLEYVGRQTDSTGVFLDRSIHVTGGYSVIHKNIPIFTMVHYEFQEFGLSVQTRMNEVALLDGRPTFVSKLNRVSNFVTTENTPLLLKYLIQQSEYNYWVIRKDRAVINVGYETVFTSGTMRVLRRSFSDDSEKELKRIEESIPLGKNSTILEYEGSWLHTYGLHEKAIERLNFVSKLSRPRPRVFQLLSLCYSALGDKQKAQQLYEECLRTYGNVCSYPQRRIVLHSEYNLDLNIKV